MPQYTMHSEYASYVAMDVHSRSITVAALDIASGETRKKRFADCPSAADIAQWCSSWMTEPIYYAYESGPCGFQLQRDFEALGHSCNVIAVTSIARNAEDKMKKDDRRDAQRLLSEITKIDSKVKIVYVPSPHIEALRDLVRARDDAAIAAKRSKQLTSSMLTRYGIVWNEKTPTGKLASTWTQKYISWAKDAPFVDPVAKAALNRYINTAVEDMERVRQLDKECFEQANEPDVKPYIDALCRLVGVGLYTALVFYSSMGDFERFGNARSVSSYYGLTPKRRNSGEKANANGKITKAGDTLCRKTIVEGLCGSLESSTANAKPLKKNQRVSPEVEAEARKCNARLRSRFRHLVKQGKNPNVARVAVASECVSDMWFIGRMVQRELQRS